MTLWRINFFKVRFWAELQKMNDPIPGSLAWIDFPLLKNYRSIVRRSSKLKDSLKKIAYKNSHFTQIGYNAFALWVRAE